MLDIPQILLSDAAQITGVEFSTLSSWIARGAIELTPYDQPAKGRGGRTLITLRTLYGVAFVAEMTAFGMSPGQAGATAQDFTHIPFFYGEPRLYREAGELFEEGETVFLVYKPSKSNGAADPQSIIGHRRHTQFVNVKDPADYANIFVKTDAGEGSAIVINCNVICQRVDDGLKKIRAERRGAEGV